MSLAGAQFWTQQFVAPDTGVYAGVRVYHYEAGTTTDTDVWTNESKSSAAAQPVVGDGQGRVSFYGDNIYRLVVKTSVADGDVQLYDYDNVKIMQKDASFRAENRGASYPSATSSNVGLIFAKVDSTGDITEVGCNKDGTQFSPFRFSGDAITGVESWGKGADLASATTLTLGTDGNSFDVTGTTTITGISAATVGTIIILQFDGALVLTHNATSLILKDAVNYKTTARDSFVFLSLGSGNWQEIARGVTKQSIASDRSVFQGRLTLTTGTPITTSDVTAAATLYLTPYGGNKVALYDGSQQWNVRALVETSLAVPAVANTVYDVFAYDDSGTVKIEALAWTNDTTRATALTTQDGVYVKTGDTTRRYVGSFRTLLASQCHDTVLRRWLWNYYNRVERPMAVVESTNSWGYTTDTYRQADGHTGNQLDFVIGVSEDAVWARVVAHCTQDTTTKTASVGIGLDSTSVNSAVVQGGGSAVTFSGQPDTGMLFTAEYRAAVAVGRHKLVWLEKSAVTNTTNWYGDNNDNDVQCGIIGSVWG